MLQDFHFKIIHRLGNKHSNVDALNKNHVFVSNEEGYFKAYIPDQATTISKTAMESRNRSFHDKTKIHEIQNIFILLEMTKERLEQLADENSHEQRQELILKNVPICTLSGYFKHNLYIIDYEQMVMQAQ